jgi:hypothetical protein
MRTIYALLLAFSLCSAALAQTTGDGARGSTPPGASHDGAAPADGAIKGGSIVPGEQGGMPGPKDPTGTTSGERLQRCGELTGVLRTDCLQKERSAAGGSSARPERDRDNDERDLQK